ncbi:uncharacterized protein LOC131183176 [Hevea brasiliensis]|uniref:uncharacterized protein LOC131183176 n=1 Tax=Hevea brasiliensis TaxID=3981 RepID=UPI0025F6FEB9|nr:uncharacterized protein LOC131183176 [Hevea brasiliensis]
MSSDPSKHGSPRYVEEEVESYAPAHTQERDRKRSHHRVPLVTKAIPIQRSPLEKLRKYRSVDFKGTKEDDPTAAEHWLERTERWWVTVSRVVQPIVITWDFFLAEFKKEYVSHVYLEARWREFLALRQKQLIVSEHVREFVQLSRYAWEMMPTEADRCRQFKDRLNDDSRLMVTAHQISNFSQLIAAALNVERVRESEQTQKGRQHKRESGQGQSSMLDSGSKKPKGSQD